MRQRDSLALYLIYLYVCLSSFGILFSVSGVHMYAVILLSGWFNAQILIMSVPFGSREIQETDHEVEILHVTFF